MSSPALSANQARLLEATRMAAREAGEPAAAGAGEVRPPAVGDLYLLRATADFPVHWLLLEEPAAGAFLAVAADAHPFSGPHDLTVTTPVGPLRLRGQVTVSLSRQDLEPELRLGALAELETARARRAVAGRLGGAPAGADDDGGLHTELEDWLDDVLRPVLAGGKRAARPEPAAPVPRRRWSRASIALAAALLAICLGLLGWTLLQGRLMAQMASRLAEFESTPSRPGMAQEVVVNAPMAILYPDDRRRSSGKRYHWPATTPAMALSLVQGEEYPSYRLVIEPEAGGKEVWRGDDLRLIDGNAVQLILPRQLFPAAGPYRLSLYGLRAGEAHPLGQYGLDLELEE